jgi:hypothetical protein
MTTPISVTPEMSTLKKLLDDQSKLTDKLAETLNQLGPSTALAYVTTVQKVRVEETATTLSRVNWDPDGLLQAIQATLGYVTDTDSLSDLDVLLNGAKGPKAAEVMKAYRDLVDARLQLSLAALALRAMMGPPPTTIPPGTLTEAPTTIAEVAEFNKYLQTQEDAVQFIKDNGVDLPSENVLKRVLSSWQRVIDTQLPIATSDSDIPVLTGATAVVLPTRAVRVDQFDVLDDRISALIGTIDDILGDRNLLDPSIL